MGLMDRPLKASTIDSNNCGPSPMGFFAKTRLAVDQARRELLDPSRRNRLLHAPLAGKRPWCMEIIGHDPDELFQSLCRQENFRGYAFNPSGEEQEPSDLPDQRSPTDSLSRRPSTTGLARHPRNPSMLEMGHGRAFKRNSVPKNLSGGLTKIFREARTLEEEQGVSTLYLALGFLKWLDNDQSEEASFAPLILAPVTLTRVRGSDGYALLGRDEEINANISLREKLRTDFGVALPEIPEGDNWTPSTYGLAVSAEVSRYKKWEVKPNCIGLGFFTFSKFMMWRDLDADAWPQNGLSAHPLLNALLNEDHESRDPGPITTGEEVHRSSN